MLGVEFVRAARGWDDDECELAGRGFGVRALSGSGLGEQGIETHPSIDLSDPHNAEFVECMQATASMALMELEFEQRLRDLKDWRQSLENLRTELHEAETRMQELKAEYLEALQDSKLECPDGPLTSDDVADIDPSALCSNVISRSVAKTQASF